MKVIINGSEGRMGKVIQGLAENNEKIEVAARVDMYNETDAAAGLYKTITDFTGDADVIIDFSNHAATKDICDYSVERQIPIVIATTGHTAQEKDIIYKTAEKNAVFFSYNMSLGIAVLADIAKRTAKMFPDAEIEIVETHHDKKLDVPSGTAILLAEAIKQEKADAQFNVGRHENGKRTKEEIGIHSLRIGNVVGIHEIHISTGTQTLTLKHEAHDRALFAEGAVAAAGFICEKKPGLYTMNDMMKEN